MGSMTSVARGAPEPRGASRDVSRVRSRVRALLSRWPPLPEAQREAFRALVTDEECEKLGAGAKAAPLLAKATRFCVAVDRALRAHPFALRRYGTPRFVWLLECVHVLEDALHARASRGAASDRRQRVVERAMRFAQETREDLAMALEVAASGRGDAEERLRAAMVPAKTPAELSLALRALADLAEELEQAFDGRTRALVASVSLRADDVTLARARAESLDAAARDRAARADTGRGGAHVYEGRVLAEMRFAERVLTRLRARDPSILALARLPPARTIAATDRKRARKRA